MSKTKVSDLRSLYTEAMSEATDWFTEGKDISRFLLPKHGRFDNLSNPIKKNATNRSLVVNPVAKLALEILVSGLHGRLTGQNRAWCRLEFANDLKNSVLNSWLYDTQKRLHKAWNLSNFYEAMPLVYKECAGFGTNAIHMGDSDTRIFNFDVMTFGEYVFTLDPNGELDKFFHRIEMSVRQMELRYGLDKLPEGLQQVAKDKKASMLQKCCVINAIFREKYLDKPIKSVHFLEGGTSGTPSSAISAVNQDPERALKVSGYYDWPVMVPRWDVVGSYPFGIGVGSDILNLVKRLQEMEKTFLMASHLQVQPPYNIPIKMKGQTNLLPGGHNYTSDPDHKIEPIVNGGFQYDGVSNAAERVEHAIQRMCYNDVFLTGMRDPNASPLKARQVDAQEDEGIIRMGPFVGRFYKELLTPIVHRSLSSLMRRNLLMPIDPQILKEAGGINVILIGPLAQAQKLIEVRSIQNFFSFMGALVPFDDSARDKVNVDRTIDEVADMTGVPSIVLSTPEELQRNRQNRQAQAQAQQEERKALVQAQIQKDTGGVQASAAKDYAAAGVDISEVLKQGAI